MSTVLCVIAGLFMSGCAASMISMDIHPPFISQQKVSEEEKKRVYDILGQVDLRNRTVEKDPQWIESSYQGFMIKNLSEIEERDYPLFNKYLDNGAVYIVVHPAYYTFFQDPDVRYDNDPGKNPMHAMDRFLSEPAYSSKSRLIKVQEKMLRDFLEYKSTEKKLVILILPRGYRNYQAYRYKDRKDEFMRFLNSVTNGSESVLYVYSKKPNRGSLTEKEKKRLSRFLYSARTTNIILGGGYAGRCVEDFYKDIDHYFAEEKIAIHPEITAMSPSDITDSFASEVLLPDGTLNLKKLSFRVRTNTLGNEEVTPLIRNASENE